MLTGRIYHWADRTPDKAAVIYNGHAVRYDTFAAYISRARGFFAQRGVGGPGVAVLLAWHLMDFWMLSLALRSLGLDTVAVRDAAAVAAMDLPGIRLVVTTEVDMTPAFPDICAGRGWPLLQAALEGAPDLPMDQGPWSERQGGHILTTSGTTGVQKAVLMDPVFEADFFRIRREQAEVTAASVVNVFGFNPWMGVGYKSPASTWDVGGTVLIHQSPELYRSLLHPGLTHATLTPLLVRDILAVPVEAFAGAPHPRVQIGGGAVAQAAIDGLKARLGPNLYSVISSTETSTFALTRLETPDDRRWHQPAPGRGLQIVDDHDQPAPTGQVGRVRVSTDHGPTAYLNDPEATAAFFKGGYFYPGDLAVMREDGRIALQGRITDVLNISGDKIAPGPIEESLEASLGVSGVCLFTAPNAEGLEEIHAVIECPGPIDEARIVEALGAVLTSGQLRYYVMPVFPRNAMGKVVRPQVRQDVLAAGRGREGG